MISCNDQDWFVVLSINDWEKNKHRTRKIQEKLLQSGYKPVGDTQRFYPDSGVVGDGCYMKRTFIHN